MASTPSRRARLSSLARSSAGIAVAVAVMNVATYGVQMISAHMLGPVEYGAVASMTAVIMVLGVVQLGLQATAARQIAATPDQVGAIEAATLRIGWQTAGVLGLFSVGLAPVTTRLLNLDGVVPAVLVGLTMVPVTVIGAYAGVLQGERRWLPLSILYLLLGLPRLALTAGFLMLSPTQTSAMAAILVGAWTPVAFAVWVVRRRRRGVNRSASAVARSIVAETTTSSLALLAFVSLSSLDVVVARSALDTHDAGLYAAGLIITKAVLFLPQFLVVVLFPAMANDQESASAISKGVALLAGLGALGVVATWLLSDLLVVFIGGEDYASVGDQLWLFATLGALLSLLQLLVYAGIARQGASTKYVVIAGVVLLVAIGLTTSSITELAATVGTIDAAAVVTLIAVQIRHSRR